MVVAKDSILGLFINGEQIVSSKNIEKNKNNMLLEVTTNKGEKAKLKIAFKDGVLTISVEPEKQGKIKSHFVFLPTFGSEQKSTETNIPLQI